MKDCETSRGDTGQPDESPRPGLTAQFFGNDEIIRLAAHTTLHSLAWAVSGVFWTVYLLRAGLPPAMIFLALAGISLLRFVFRPLVLWTLPILGPRRTLIMGGLLSALQYPSLALVHGLGPELRALLRRDRLRQRLLLDLLPRLLRDAWRFRAARQPVGNPSGAGIDRRRARPGAGRHHARELRPVGSLRDFCLARALATLPLIKLPEPRFLREAPRGAYASAKIGVVLFFTDGWVITSSSLAWDIIAFRGLGTRFDNFGMLLAFAALSGAVGVSGRLIDRGFARRAVGVNGFIVIGTLLFKSLCGDDPTLIVAATTVATLLGGIYIPSLMTAVYNEAKAAPCALRFQFAAEGGGMPAALSPASLAPCCARPKPRCRWWCCSPFPAWRCSRRPSTPIIAPGPGRSAQARANWKGDDLGGQNAGRRVPALPKPIGVPRAVDRNYPVVEIGIDRHGS